MLKTNNAALMIIDVQGNLAEQMHNKSGLYHNLSILIQGARLLSLPVLWVEQLPDKLGATRPEIACHLDGEPMAKSTFSACADEAIGNAIDELGRTQWLVAGIEAHVCVYQTVRDLLVRHYQVHVISDAVASREADNRQIALQRMQAQGAILNSTEMALFELQQKAEGDTFRSLVKLLK